MPVTMSGGGGRSFSFSVQCFVLCVTCWCLCNLRPCHCKDDYADGLQAATSGEADHRVRLRPGVWKILTSEVTYVAYQFFIGYSWTETDLSYPECEHVACAGLSAANLPGCAHMCSSPTMHDAQATLRTATNDYRRAAVMLDVTFNDLAAIMDTRISKHHSTTAPYNRPAFRGTGTTGESPHVVDVMLAHRSLILQASRDLVEMLSKPAVSDYVKNSPLPGASSNGSYPLAVITDAWKSGAFKLAVLLNSATLAFHDAKEHLLRCAQGVARNDMSGCYPEFTNAFYVDTPISSSSLSASKLVALAVRNAWRPTRLSRWYMPFLDSSEGNRTCWLAKPMVTDEQGVNYDTPECDFRGLCEPLESNDDILSKCAVADGRVVKIDCPISCHGPCFGPVCYRRDTNAFAMRTSPHVHAGTSGGSNADGGIITTPEPRVLTSVLSLSDQDIRASLDRMKSMSADAADMLTRGAAMLEHLKHIKRTAEGYIARTHTKPRSKDITCRRECEKTLARSRFMATLSIIFSALTCPFLILLAVRTKKIKK